MYAYQPFQVNQGAFQNPLGNVAPQLGAAISGVANAPQVTAATSPLTASGGAGQLSTAGTLNDIGTGAIPSAASIQAGQTGAANLAAAESMLGSARGAGSPAAAQLAARQGQAQQANQTQQAAVLGAANEQVGALGAAGGLYGGAAGTGLGVTGQANTIGMANQQALEQAQQAQLQALIQENQQQQQGAQAGQVLGVQNALGSGQIQNTAFNNAAANNQKALSGLFSGISGLAAAA
jgi:hypothetical protein